MTVRVLISDAMDPKAAAIFRERGIRVDEITGQTPDELKAIIGDYDGLAIRSSTKVTKDILAAATPGLETAPGLFVCFEGGDGAGKSTQVHLLTDALERRGRRVLVTRQPGGTALGGQIRELVLHGDHVAARAEALLYAADKAHHVDEVILPALRRGEVVLTDPLIARSTLEIHSNEVWDEGGSWSLGTGWLSAELRPMVPLDGAVPTYLGLTISQEPGRLLTGRGLDVEPLPIEMQPAQDDPMALPAAGEGAEPRLKGPLARRSGDRKSATAAGRGRQERCAAL